MFQKYPIFGKWDRLEHKNNLKITNRNEITIKHHFFIWKIATIKHLNVESHNRQSQEKRKKWRIPGISSRQYMAISIRAKGLIRCSNSDTNLSYSSFSLPACSVKYASLTASSVANVSWCHSLQKKNIIYMAVWVC